MGFGPSELEDAPWHLVSDYRRCVERTKPGVWTGLRVLTAIAAQSAQF